MSLYYDLTNEKYGKLTPVRIDRERMNEEKARKGGYTKTYWICKCECGNEKSISYDALNRGFTRSCGCIRGRKK